MAKTTSAKNTVAKETTRKVARSAKTGEFVTRQFAKEHPSTTEVETVKISATAKKA